MGRVKGHPFRYKTNLGPHLLPYVEEDSQGIDIGQTRTTWAYRVTSTWPSKNTKIVLYDTWAQGRRKLKRAVGNPRKLGGGGLKTTKSDDFRK